MLFLAIVAFYLIKGTMQLHRAADRAARSSASRWLDRVIHWSTAITFSTLAITGLIMLFGKTVLLPLIGYTLFSWLAILAKNLHNFVGPLFAVCIVLLFVNFVRDNFPQPRRLARGSATSAGCSRAATRRRASSTPARSSGSGAARSCWASW